MKSGRFACGRVLQLDISTGKVDRRRFYAGLMNWSDQNEPTPHSIAGVKILKAGKAHIKTITANNSMITGYRPIEYDNLEIPLSLSNSGGINTWICRGFEILRPATQKEKDTLPVLGVWGFNSINILAEKHFSQE